MALGGGDEILGLDFVKWSLPFVAVDSFASTDSRTLDYLNWSLPFVTAPSGTVAPVNSNVYVNISGTWQAASAVYVNVSGVWKTATDGKIYYNDSGSWYTD